MKQPKTFIDLCTWIAENTYTHGRDVTETAYWFTAYEQARQLRDLCDIKDWAHMLLEGITPINHNPHEVTHFLEAQDDVLSLLKEHFEEQGTKKE